MTVQIYVYVAPGFGKVKHGKAIWLVEANTIKGPATKYGIIKEDNISIRRLFLKALLEAQEQLNKSCLINLFVEDEFFKSCIYRSLINKWHKNGYLTARGKPVKNSDLWEKLYQLSNMHSIQLAERTDHEYRSWMITQLKRG